MKFLVMGTGAIGSAFGGFLRLAGHNVTLVGRLPHIRAIERNGLCITGIWGNHIVKGFELYTDTERISDKFDVLLVTVKSYDTEDAGRRIRGFISSETLIVSLQNGIGNVESLIETTHHSSILGGRVIFGSVLTAPGTIEITVYTQPVMIGFPSMINPSGSMKTSARNLARIINESGIPCNYTDEIEKYLWAKLLYSCALNPLSAIRRVHYGALGEDEETRSIMEGIVREIFAVAKARGVPMFWDEPEEFLNLFYSKLLPYTYHHRSSMLQDIERGKKTEIDNLCGMVVKYGKMYGVNTPLNQKMVELIHKMTSEQKNEMDLQI